MIKINSKKTLSTYYYYHLVIIFYFIYSTNCIIEIPLEPIEIIGVPKFPNIKLKEPLKYSKSNLINKTLLIENGGTKLNKNLLFLAKVKIGSKNNEFNLLLDTGSIIVWVANIKSSNEHYIEHRFDPKSSSTCAFTKKTFNQEYGTGSCSGYYYIDNFKYINDIKFNITFGVADNTNFEIDKGDGILGLAHDYFGEYDESMSFIHMLKEYKITDSKSFSIKFGEDLDAGVSGKLFIGKHKDFMSDETIVAPLVNPWKKDNFWKCKINGIGFKNDEGTLDVDQNYDMIFDTGTNVIILPYSYLPSISTTLPSLGCGIEISSDGYYLIYCHKDYLVDLRIKINNKILIVPSDYTFYELPSGFYYSRILFSNNNKINNIIGTPFFLAFHTLFDKENESLHFYPEKRDFSEDSNLFTIIVIILIIILLIVLLGFIFYKFILWQRAKREMNRGFPSSNYNNIHGFNQNFL